MNDEKDSIRFFSFFCPSSSFFPSFLSLFFLFFFFFFFLRSRFRENKLEYEEKETEEHEQTHLPRHGEPAEKNEWFESVHGVQTIECT